MRDCATTAQQSKWGDHPQRYATQMAWYPLSSRNGHAESAQTNTIAEVEPPSRKARMPDAENGNHAEENTMGRRNRRSLQAKTFFTSPTSNEGKRMLYRRRPVPPRKHQRRAYAAT